MSKGHPTPRAPQNRPSPGPPPGVQVLAIVGGFEAGVVDSATGPMHSLLWQAAGGGRVDLRYPIEEAPKIADAIMESYNEWKAARSNGDRLEVVRRPGLILPPGAGG